MRETEIETERQRESKRVRETEAERVRGAERERERERTQTREDPVHDQMHPWRGFDTPLLHTCSRRGELWVSSPEVEVHPPSSRPGHPGQQALFLAVGSLEVRQ